MAEAFIALVSIAVALSFARSALEARPGMHVFWA